MANLEMGFFSDPGQAESTQGRCAANDSQYQIHLLPELRTRRVRTRPHRTVNPSFEGKAAMSPLDGGARDERSGQGAGVEDEVVTQGKSGARNMGIAVSGKGMFRAYANERQDPLVSPDGAHKSVTYTAFGVGPSTLVVAERGAFMGIRRSERTEPVN
ncbi:hypothetical protein JHW43_000022 [Diplocarpon mali]|nr:hypothetical protein JHW43_000022 [Diplocarpon mali]